VQFEEIEEDPKYKLPPEIIKQREKKKVCYEFEKRTFNWLMEKLQSDNERILGCEINIPDTVILDNGAPKQYLKTEKNGCITQINKKDKSTLNTL